LRYTHRPPDTPPAFVNNPGYTGVTRGKKLVVLVGQRKAVGIAVRSAEGGRRWSKLRELLESAVGNRAAHLT